MDCLEKVRKFFLQGKDKLLLNHLIINLQQQEANMQDEKNKQEIQQADSNAERDQDEGQMNNGVIGGNMGVIGNNGKNQPESEISIEESKPENDDVEKSENNK